MNICEIFEIKTNKNNKINIINDTIQIIYLPNSKLSTENYPKLKSKIKLNIELIICFSMNINFLNIKYNKKIQKINKIRIISLNIDLNDIISFIPEKNKHCEIYIKINNKTILNSKIIEHKNLNSNIPDFDILNSDINNSNTYTNNNYESLIIDYNNYIVNSEFNTKLNFKNIEKIIIILTKPIKSIGEYFKIIFNRNKIDCELKYNLVLEDCINSIYNPQLIYLILFNKSIHNILPNRFIFYQIEQIESVFLTNKFFFKRFKYMCIKSEQIWIYSKTINFFFKKYDFIFKKIKLVPLPFVKQTFLKLKYLNDYLNNDDSNNNDSCNYDIFFYGHKNFRRNKILLELKKHFENRIKIGYGYYGNKKIKYIIKSKIIINIHYYKNTCLETCRINEILNFNKIIISEKSCLDKFNTDLYKDIVVFVDEINDDLSNILLFVTMIKKYLDKDKYIEKINYNMLKIKNLEQNIISKIFN